MDVPVPTEVLPDRDGMTVAVDTETSGLFTDDGATVSIVSIAWTDGDTVVSYAFPFDQGPLDKVDQIDLLAEDVNLPESEWRYLLQWLKRQWLVFQNAKFDLHHLRNGTRHWDGEELESRLAWDTMLASRELDPLENTSLKPTAERLGLTGGGEQDEKDAMAEALKYVAKKYKMGKRYDMVSWDVSGKYAAKDTELTILLHDHQRARIEEGEIPAVWVDREMALTRVLYRIERRGMGYDSEASMAAADKLRELQAEIAEQLPFAPSVNAAKRYFFGPKSEGGLGLVPYDVTPVKREPKLDDEIVRRMVEDEVPHADEYQEWRKYDYSVSMHYAGYPALAGPDGRLRTSFRQGKVVSGRMSVERVQVQAITHKSVSDQVPPVRKLFLPRPGNRLWEIDWSQAELRVAAKLARCEAMLELIEAGEDLHGITAIKLFDTNPDADDWFFYRQISKRGNFSFIFDVGPDTFRQTIKKLADVDLTPTESADIVNTWKGLYPEFGRAVRTASRRVEDRRRGGHDGYVRLVGGKLRWFAPHEHSHKAFNQAVQASLAEAFKDWTVMVEDAYEDVEGLVNSVHDSAVLDIPDGEEKRLDTLKPVWEEWATAHFGVPMELDIKEWHA